MRNTTKNPLPLAGLIFLIGGQLLPQSSFSVVNVALQAMQESFHTGEIGLILIVALYALCFAAFIAAGARLGDKFGRKKIYLLGIVGFCIGSLICGLTSNLGVMLLGRMLQGGFGALIMPQILSIIHARLEGKRHARAVSIFMAVGGLSVVLGQVVGGWIISANWFDVGWHAAFLIYLPLGIVFLLGGYFSIPEMRLDDARNMDALGITLLGAMMLCLLLPTAMGHQYPVLFWLFVLLLPLGFALVKVESRQEKNHEFPIIPPSLFRIATMRVGALAEAVVISTYVGYLFVVALCLQQALHFTSLQTGDAFVGIGATFMIGSLLTKPLRQKIHDYWSFLFGAVFTTLSLISTAWAFWYFQPMPISVVLVVSGLLGLGNAFMLTACFNIALSEVPARQSSEASTTLITVQQGMYAIATAFAGSLYAALMNHGYRVALAGVCFALEILLVLAALMIFGFNWRQTRGRTQALRAEKIKEA